MPDIITTSPVQPSLLHPQTRIFVAGHRGMVGSALVRRLTAEGLQHIITRTHQELDLTNQQAVRDFFRQAKVDYVVLAAAQVGGIHANNTYPAEFITNNLLIQTNVIFEAYKAGIDKLLFLGSSCIYPKFAPQPMKEEYLLTGELEPTNEPYAIAKIAGIKMCEAFNRQYGTFYRSAMPTNLYGPGDSYHLENSHVIPAMIRKFHLAKLAMAGNLQAIQQDEGIYGLIPPDIKEAIGLAPDSSALLPQAGQAKVLLWGSGNAYREFLHVDDMASACVFIMRLQQKYFEDCSFVNIGTGSDQSIKETAQAIQQVVGFEGQIDFDKNKPDGSMKKLLDTRKINLLGWKPSLDLKTGLKDSYDWYLSKSANDSARCAPCPLL